MKHPLLFLAFALFSPLFLTAQNYTITYSSETYTPLAGATLLDESNPDIIGLGYELYQPIPIGFSFDLWGDSYDSLRVGELGYVSFNNGVADKHYISIFDCFLKDFQDNPALSPIYYETTGTPGDQVFKLEFVNKGFINDSEDNDYVNFQLFIYESCSEFEVRIGSFSTEPSEIDLYFNNSTMALIGTGQYNPGLYYGLAGDPTNPNLQSDALMTLSAEPDSGTVYHFSECNLSLEEENTLAFELYPNPANHQINLITNSITGISEIRLLNMMGQQIAQYPATQTVIDVSSFEKGVYFVSVVLDNEIITQRFIKQ